MTIYGGTNWLILSAPYFFPMAPLLAYAGVVFGPDEWQQVSLLGFGATVGFYGLALLTDVHRNQTDLQEVGFPFAWCFLPSANLAVLGILLCAAVGDASTVEAFIDETLRISLDGLQWVRSLVAY